MKLSPTEFASKTNGIAQNVVNATMITELRSLLNMVKTAKLKVVPIQRINLDAPTTPIHMATTNGTTPTTTTGTTTTGTVTTTTGSTTTGGVMVANVTCNCIAFRCNRIGVACVLIISG